MGTRTAGGPTVGTHVGQKVNHFVCGAYLSANHYGIYQPSRSTLNAHVAPTLMTLRILPAALLFVATSAACSSASPPTLTSTFLYGWYSTPQTDGLYGHWNHSLLPHWTAAVRARYPENVSWKPPADLHSAFYPRGGPYSSNDDSKLRAQLAEMSQSGVGAAIVSWWGRAGTSGGDSQGVRTESFLARVFAEAEAAAAAGIACVRVAPHLEPYAGRDAAAVRADIEHLSSLYGDSPAWLRVDGRRVYYVYDSYHIHSSEWSRVLKPQGDSTVRGDAAVDGFFIGLWLDRHHGGELASGGFDGAYTYFASAGQSYGSSPEHWSSMVSEANQLGLRVVPCVGPGYDDSKIRPWNAAATRAREGGAYYTRMWQAALASGARHVGVTSWNEWGEGTQVEPAEPRTVDVAALAPLGEALDADLRARLGAKDAYEDYTPHGPDYYLTLTREFSLVLGQAAGDAEAEL
jgi:glycoprotein endo-alpha-1,2-mannosidase